MIRITQTDADEQTVGEITLRGVRSITVEGTPPEVAEFYRLSDAHEAAAGVRPEQHYSQPGGSGNALFQYAKDFLMTRYNLPHRVAHEAARAFMDGWLAGLK